MLQESKFSRVHTKFTENDDGGWSFECQHGEDECFGNKVQKESCTLDSSCTLFFQLNH